MQEKNIIPFNIESYIVIRIEHDSGPRLWESQNDVWRGKETISDSSLVSRRAVLLVDDNEKSSQPIRYTARYQSQPLYSYCGPTDSFETSAAGHQ